jgi:type IV pilus assembly protein PilO
MPNLTKEQQKTIAAVVLAVGAFTYVYWNYMMKPTNAKIVQLKQDLATKQEQVETTKREALRLPAIKREYEALVLEVGETEKLIPKEKGLDNVLRTVTEEAIRLNIQVISFSPRGISQKTYYNEIPIDLSIQANFHSLGHLLATLGQKERIMNSRNVQMTALSANQNSPTGHTVQVTLSLAAYAFR